MLKRLLEARVLQDLADRLGLRLWERFLIWRHDLSTRDKMRRVFKRRADPFRYAGSAYETRRFEAMLALVADRRHESALEVGCAEGRFTALLAPRCGRLVAVDLSAAALERARRNVASPQVAWTRANIRDWLPAERFDLIVLGDVAYYLGDPKKGPSFDKAYSEFCGRVRSWLRPGGRVLLANGFGSASERARNDDYAARLERLGLRRLRDEVCGDRPHDKAGMRCSLHLLELPA
ncbi:MAG: methyltransferase domain-containing protein [Elusimicrobia bacterium]|nr:methyltransferase domain-containing protein [Elusimicrobiota bacterium]